MMTSLAPEGDASAPQAGADLMAARERLGRTLPEMAHYLRIRLPFLVAIEQGRLGELPGSAYALAFLRTYATALGLDADEVLRRFKAEAAAIDRKTSLAFPAPLAERGLPTGALMLLALVLVVAAYAGWYRLSGDGRLPAEAVQPVPARLAQLTAPPAAPAAKSSPAPGPAAGGPLPAGTGQTAATMTAAGASATPTASPTASPNGTPAVPRPTILATTQPSSPGPASAPTIASQPAATPDVPAGSAAAATPTAAQDAAMRAGSVPQLVILATSDAWIQVRDPTGAVVFSRLLHSGQTWPVPAGQALALTTGNAGGTELVANGVASAPLGAAGAVLRNISLAAGPAPSAAPTSAAPAAAPTPATPATSAPAASPTSAR